ncbi:MAG: hypothetical protein A2Y40_07700 [Candidatus Margulisbacteria bacterium GWF2_35_9]|nr:MAG: hypothetical protein A2Y40_07700 [Candidatus Margulisbacteria bacterium GWF2_35_9]
MLNSKFLSLLLGLVLILSNVQSFSQVKDISLDEMIGQMIMLGFEGTRIDDTKFKDIKGNIIQNKIGGVVFFDRNIININQVKEFISSINALDKKEPLFIAIDQEGGQVSRLKSNRSFKTFPSAKYVAQHLSTAKAFDLYYTMAITLKNIGFNLNFAPVVDVDINPKSPAISLKNRSFSSDPKTVINYARTFVLAHKKANVLTTLKHYPGHGSATTDSHFGFTDITHTWNDLESIPYRTLIKEKSVNIIMSAHLFNSTIDDRFPASLSKVHLGKILRHDMKYKGIIITDDLQMGAISKSFDLNTVIINAINAGNDILLFANYFTLDPHLADKIIDIIKLAIESGVIKKKQIQLSYKRIIHLKRLII